MELQEAVDFIKTDPSISMGEKEFSVHFTKKSEKATVYTTIASQVKRLLNHSEVEQDEITVYNEDTETYSTTTVEDFDGEGRIVAFKGTVPIECLKIQANPRSQRSYANIISPQNEVSFDS